MESRVDEPGKSIATTPSRALATAQDIFTALGVGPNGTLGIDEVKRGLKLGILKRKAPRAHKDPAKMEAGEVVKTTSQELVKKLSEGLQELGKASESPELAKKAADMVSRSEDVLLKSMKDGPEDLEAKMKVSQATSSVGAVVKQLTKEKEAASEGLRRIASEAKSVQDTIAAAETKEVVRKLTSTAQDLGADRELGQSDVAKRVASVASKVEAFIEQAPPSELVAEIMPVAAQVQALGEELAQPKAQTGVAADGGSEGVQRQLTHVSNQLDVMLEVSKEAKEPTEVARQFAASVAELKEVIVKSPEVGEKMASAAELLEVVAKDTTGGGSESGEIKAAMAVAARLTEMSKQGSVCAAESRGEGADPARESQRLMMESELQRQSEKIVELVVAAAPQVVANAVSAKISEIAQALTQKSTAELGPDALNIAQKASAAASNAEAAVQCSLADEGRSSEVAKSIAKSAVSLKESMKGLVGEAPVSADDVAEVSQKAFDLKAVSAAAQPEEVAQSLASAAKVSSLGPEVEQKVVSVAAHLHDMLQAKKSSVAGLNMEAQRSAVVEAAKLGQMLDSEQQAPTSPEREVKNFAEQVEERIRAATEAPVQPEEMAHKLTASAADLRDMLEQCGASAEAQEAVKAVTVASRKLTEMSASKAMDGPQVELVKSATRKASDLDSAVKLITDGAVAAGVASAVAQRSRAPTAEDGGPVSAMRSGKSLTRKKSATFSNVAEVIDVVRDMSAEIAPEETARKLAESSIVHEGMQKSSTLSQEMVGESGSQASAHQVASKVKSFVQQQRSQGGAQSEVVKQISVEAAKLDEAINDSLETASTAGVSAADLVKEERVRGKSAELSAMVSAAEGNVSAEEVSKGLTAESKSMASKGPCVDSRVVDVVEKVASIASQFEEVVKKQSTGSEEICGVEAAVVIGAQLQESMKQLSSTLIPGGDVQKSAASDIAGIEEARSSREAELTTQVLAQAEKFNSMASRAATAFEAGSAAGGTAGEEVAVPAKPSIAAVSQNAVGPVPPSGERSTEASKEAAVVAATSALTASIAPGQASMGAAAQSTQEAKQATEASGPALAVVEDMPRQTNIAVGTASAMEIDVASEAKLVQPGTAAQSQSASCDVSQVAAQVTQMSRPIAEIGASSSPEVLAVEAATGQASTVPVPLSMADQTSQTAKQVAEAPKPETVVASSIDRAPGAGSAEAVAPAQASASSAPQVLSDHASLAGQQELQASVSATAVAAEPATEAAVAQEARPECAKTTAQQNAVDSSSQRVGQAIDTSLGQTATSADDEASQPVK